MRENMSVLIQNVAHNLFYCMDDDCFLVKKSWVPVTFAAAFFVLLNMLLTIDRRSVLSDQLVLRL